MNTRFKIFASYNILHCLCDFIHVPIFVTVSKCRKSPKLTNIVIILHLHRGWKSADADPGPLGLPLKVVPASNQLNEVSYGIRTISGLFVGWMRDMLIGNNLLSLSPTYSTYRRKSQAQVGRHIQTSYWVVDWFDVILHGAFQIFKKQDLMMLLYRHVVALSPCQRIIIVHTGNAN
jgi:hypothetical protein